MVCVIQDPRACFTMKKSFVAVALQLLDHVGADMDAALATALASNFRKRDAPVALGDALVMIDQIFRHRGNRGGTHGLCGGQFLLRGVIFGLDRLAFLDRGRFDFLHRRLGGLHLPVVLLARDHAFEQTVLGLGHFVFGVLDFVQQGFVCFVGLDLAALVSIFLGALFPLIDVHLKRLALFLAREERFLGRGDLLLRRSHARLDFSQLFWEPRQALSNANQAEINSLQFNE